MITPKQAQELIDEINKSKYKFNRWELDFMRSVDDLIRNNRHLSDRRSDALQQIYRRSQKGG